MHEWASYLARPYRPLRVACREMLYRFCRLPAAVPPGYVAGDHDNGESTGVLIELLPDAVLVFQAKKIVFANSAAARIHGAESADQLIGMMTLDLVDPDAHEFIRRRRELAEAGRRTEPVVHGGVRLDGSTFLAENRITRFTWHGAPATLVVIRDITERVQSEKVLQESELQYRSLFELAPDAMLVTDYGRIIFCNPAAVSLFGAESPEQLVGRSHLELVNPDDTPALQARIDVGPEVMHEIQFLGVRRFRLDGTEFISESCSVPFVWDGKAVRLVTIRDITERKQAEQALRDSEARYRDLVEGSHLGICIAAKNGDYLFVNNSFRNLFCYGADDDPGYIRSRIIAPHDRDRIFEQAKARGRGEDVPPVYEFDAQRKDGAIVPIQVFVREILWDGQAAFQRTFFDLTARKQAEQALIDSEARYRGLIEGSQLALQIKRQDGSRCYVNQAFVDLFGYETKDEVCGQAFGSFVASHDLKRVEQLRTARENGEQTPSVDEFDARRQDGSVFPVQVFIRPIVWEGNYAQHRTYIDLTERKRAEQALIDSEARYRELIEGSQLGVQISARDGTRKLVNHACAEMFGYASPEELIAAAPMALIADYDRDKVRDCREAYLEGRSKARYYEFDGVRKDGSVFPVAAYMRRIEWDGEEAVQRTFIDLTARKQAEQALIDSEARYRDLIEGSDLGIQVLNHTGKRIFANRACVDLFGYSSLEELLAAPRGALVALHDTEWIASNRKELFDNNLKVPTREFDGLRRDGSVVPVQVFTRRITWNGEDAIQRTYIDLTERKKTEEQLRQAQKMEIVGQLTGGVAHDFNNLLTIILGNLDLIEDEVDDPALKRIALNAMEATRRGGELTQRLLAFSRKQALAPRSVNPNDLVAGMEDMMRRTLGEAIEIEFTADSETWACRADPMQLENGILNLAVNARDAMPQGGRLTFATENLQIDERETAERNDLVPGDYVMISVADTGTGMAPSVADRVFEPFFTTKDVGAGSGLGLSMVYGFAKQSGGNVMIETGEGSGTTVALYLPRSMEVIAPVPQGNEPAAPRSGSEKVLVVEDDAEVRSLTVQLLNGLGYEVLEATDGHEAIEVMKNTAGIDLLFTDVVLAGGMSGVDVAREAANYISGIKIIFASGYTDDELARHGRLDDGVHFIGKPFRKADLAHMMRAALEQSPN